jgi:hypothetical protein
MTREDASSWRRFEIAGQAPVARATGLLRRMPMAAFVLFVLAVAGAAVVADLAWENPTAGQLTVFHHTISGYPEGWLLAIAAGLGFVAALLLVTSWPEAPAVAVSVEVGGGKQLRGHVGRMRA